MSKETFTAAARSLDTTCFVHIVTHPDNMPSWFMDFYLNWLWIAIIDQEDLEH